MTMIVQQTKAATITDQLENRGFLIIKISAGAFAKPHYRPGKPHPLT
jgi:hypothetical protein